MNGPVTEDELRRLYLSGLCFHAAQFLLRGAVAEQWSMAREMVENDLADSIREAVNGKPHMHTRHTNVLFEEWLAWVRDSVEEVATDATYRAALHDAAKSITAAFFAFVPKSAARVDVLFA